VAVAAVVKAAVKVITVEVAKAAVILAVRAAGKAGADNRVPVEIITAVGKAAEARLALNEFNSQNSPWLLARRDAVSLGNSRSAVGCDEYISFFDVGVMG
jgi:hypothetical protein